LPCWTWRSRRCPRRPGPAPARRTVRGCWPGRTPPAPTHTFADACRQAGVGFSFGFPVHFRIKDIVDVIPEHCWQPAIETGQDFREGAWVAEVTDNVAQTPWQEGARLILRKERPHPGAQLTFTDAGGMRITAFLTGTPPGLVPGQLAGLELRHRQHARLEDRIRQAKATGLRNLPCRAWNENAAWLQVVMMATDLIAFADTPALARCEIRAFRYRVLHVAARITRAARQTRLRIDKTWRWAAEIAAGYHRIRAAFG